MSVSHLDAGEALLLAWGETVLIHVASVEAQIVASVDHGSKRNVQMGEF